MTAWMRHAACLDAPDLPWTTDTADLVPGQAELLAAVCASCPVLVDCWTYAAALEVTGGYWAGTDWAPAETTTRRRAVTARRAA